MKSIIVLGFLICLFLSKSTLAQVIPNATSTLDIGNINARINNSGDLFNKDAKFPAYEFPKNSGMHTIFTSSLWIGGLDEKKQLHLAAMTYRQKGRDFWPGPLDTLNATTNDSIARFYNKIWAVDKKTISLFQILKNPMPPSISNWPGNAPTNANFHPQLAPFFDKNKDGVYKPEEGDYPSIKGDKALWWVFNDSYQPHAESKGKIMGIEVHAMAYAFDTTVSPLNNTIFVEYTIYNRSLNDYDSVFIGQFTDFDLGDGKDDYVGCDSVLNYYYAYNGQLKDAVYGKNVPVQSVAFLDSPLDYFMTCHFPSKGLPSQSQEYFYLLQGKLVTGSRIQFDTDTELKRIYPGNPADTTQYSEVTAANKPGEREVIGSMGPLNLKSHASLRFTLAFITTESVSDNITNTRLAKYDVTAIKNFYNKYKPTSIQEKFIPSHFKIYPNPAQDRVQILNLHKEPFTVRIIDLSGKCVLQKSHILEETTLNVQNLKKGFYLIETKNNNAYTIEKLEILR